jgi:hypothetical protein
MSRPVPTAFDEAEVFQVEDDPAAGDGYSDCIVSIPSVRLVLHQGPRFDAAVTQRYAAGVRAIATSDDINNLASAFQSIVTGVGIIVGGVWAYFRFIKEAPYRPRTEVTIDARRAPTEPPGLWCSLALKNVGSSKIALLQRGTGLRISEGRLETDFQEPRWISHGVLKIFQQQDWIESDETIRHQLFVSLPAALSAPLLLELRLVCDVAGSENLAIYTRSVVAGPEGPIGARS